MSGFVQKIKKIKHWSFAHLANILYGQPAKDMIIIGVTGTNGKTTTATMIHHILTSSGYKAGLISTLCFKIGDKEFDNLYKMTALPSFPLQNWLARMKSAKCQYVVMEITSHALDQFRNLGIPCDVAVYTNLTHDHLDYHETMSNYKNAKLKLFRTLKKSYRKPGVNKIAIINSDDQYAEDFWKAANSDIKMAYGLGRKKAQEQITAKKIVYMPHKTKFVAETPYGETEISLPMIGKFNVYNSLAAISAAASQNISLDKIKSAIETLPQVSGRMESVENKRGINILVDFAHTPDALRKVYETLKPLTHGKTIAVFGATGERDKSKRPIMGAIATQYSDTIVVTNDDPYHENQDEIADAIIQGIHKGARGKKFEMDSNLFKILDRKEAIIKGLSLAEKGDSVIITGKGGEKVMAIGDKKIPWSDREIVEGWLRGKK